MQLTEHNGQHNTHLVCLEARAERQVHPRRDGDAHRTGIVHAELHARLALPGERLEHRAAHARCAPPEVHVLDLHIAQVLRLAHPLEPLLELAHHAIPQPPGAVVREEDAGEHGVEPAHRDRVRHRVERGEHLPHVLRRKHVAEHVYGPGLADPLRGGHARRLDEREVPGLELRGAQRHKEPLCLGVDDPHRVAPGEELALLHLGARRRCCRIFGRLALGVARVPRPDGDALLPQVNCCHTFAARSRDVVRVVQVKHRRLEDRVAGGLHRGRSARRAGAALRAALLRRAAERRRAVASAAAAAAPAGAYAEPAVDHPHVLALRARRVRPAVAAVARRGPRRGQRRAVLGQAVARLERQQVGGRAHDEPRRARAAHIRRLLSGTLRLARGRLALHRGVLRVAAHFGRKRRGGGKRRRDGWLLSRQAVCLAHIRKEQVSCEQAQRQERHAAQQVDAELAQHGMGARLLGSVETPLYAPCTPACSCIPPRSASAHLFPRSTQNV